MGLFPLFAFASMQIRPKIIDLIKTFYLPIGKDLLPCLNGLVMALVPGLEETNSEFYRSIVKLLDEVGEKVGQRNLFHSLWKTVSLNPSIRIGAINYLMERLPKKKQEGDLDMYMPNVSTLVLNAMSRAIDDPVVLVQRSVLDLLLAHFKMSEGIFNLQASAQLVRKAILLQTRREASLNRRVYTWLLGEEAAQSQEYFVKYSKQALILAINDLFQEPATTLDKAVLPFKILLALFDKPEVSAPIINEIIEDVIEALHRYCDGYPFVAEIVAQVNTVLDGLKQSVIWAFLNQFVRYDVAQYVTIPSSSGTHSPCRSLTLIGTLLDKMVGLNTFDSVTSYLPEFIKSLTHAARTAAKYPDHLHIVLQCHQVILKIIGKMQQPIAKGSAPSPAPSPAPAAAPSLTSSSGSIPPGTLPAQVLQEALKGFEDWFHDLCTQALPSHWQSEIQEAKTHMTPYLTAGQNKISFGPGVSEIHSMKKSGMPAWKRTTATTILDVASQCLVAFYSTFWSSFGILAPNPSQAPLRDWFEASVQLSESEHPLVSHIAIRTIVAFLNLPATNPSAGKLQSYLLHSTRICHSLAKRLWELLKPSLSIVHYRTATTFLDLKDICSDICEETICEALLTTELEQRLEAHQRFALLWRLANEIGGHKPSFDRALFVMLDSLNDEQPIIKLACRTWLADSISKVERILDPLLAVLLDKATTRNSSGTYQSEYDCRRVLYALKVLQSIIECDFKLWMHNAMEKPVSKDMLELHARQVLPSDGMTLNSQVDQAATGVAQQTAAKSAIQAQQVPKPQPSPAPAADAFSFINVVTYLDLLVVESLRFITGLPARNASPDFVTKNSVVQTTAVGFLQFLLSRISTTPKASEWALLLHEPILEALAQSVSDTHLILQVNLLGLIRTIVLIDDATDYSKIKMAPSKPSPQRIIDAIGQSQLFLQTISIGLLQVNPDFNIRFYWLDFVTSCLPYLYKYSHIIVPPILQCLCDIISTHRNAYDSVESKDTLMILRSMKIILHHCLSTPEAIASMMNVGIPISTSPPPGATGQAAANSGGFGNFFKGLFVSEGGANAQAADSETNTAGINAILERLDIIMKGLLKVWGRGNASFKSTFAEGGAILTGTPADPLASLVPSPSRRNIKAEETEFSADELHNRYAVQDQLLALLEMLYHASPGKFLDCLLQDWAYTTRHPEHLLSLNAPKLPQEAGFNTPQFIDKTRRHKALVIDILNHMANVPAESLFKGLSETLRACHASDQQRSSRLAAAKRRGVNFTHLQDPCIADMAVLIVDWGTKANDASLPAMMSLIRSLLASHNPHAIFIAWKLLDVYLTRNMTRKGVNTQHRRELQALVTNMCEVSLTIMNKTFVDLSASWKMTSRYLDVFDERSDPVIMDESTLSQVRTLVSLHMTLTLRDHLVSVLEKTFEDPKAAPTNHFVTSMVHQLAVAIQSESVRNATLAQESSALLERFANAPQVVDPRIWRKDAIDVFLYWGDFLRVSSVVQLRCFQKIVSILFAPKNDDGSAWIEFTRYVSKAVAAQTIFVGHLEAAIQRALSVRRLAFIILSGSYDQYLDQLPWIQEKLVEALKQREGNADTFAAVFLCLRVLMVRIKPESMRPFWPAVISEMLGVFAPGTTPEPELVLAVTKFMDVLFIQPSEQFNIHEWVFISDPIDTTRPETSWPFIPFIDKVSKRTGPTMEVSQQNLPRMVPIVPIQKLEINPNPLGMTWNEFAQWLGRYSDLQYANRVATQHVANMDDVVALLLNDFAITRLDPNDWTLLRIDMSSSEMRRDLLQTSSTVSTAPIGIAKETKQNQSARVSPSNQGANALLQPLMPQVPSSSTSPSALPPMRSTTPSPVPNAATPSNRPLEDNTNATLFGDVLD